MSMSAILVGSILAYSWHAMTAVSLYVESRN